MSDKNRKYNGMTRDEVEALTKVQERMVQVAMGQIPFEHPGAPQVPSGSQYTPNPTEKQFATRARSILYRNVFKFSFIGGAIPFITISIIRRGGINQINNNLKKNITGVNIGENMNNKSENVVNKQRFRPPIFITSTSALFGALIGVMQARLDITKEHLALVDSPLASEARYQLWKLNPDHLYLRGFQSEIDTFQSYSRYNHIDNHINDHVNPRMRGIPTKQEKSSHLNDNRYKYDDNDDEYNNNNNNNKRQRKYNNKIINKELENDELRYKYGNKNNSYVNNYDDDNNELSNNNIYNNENERITNLKRKRFYKHRDNDIKPDNMYDENEHFNNNNNQHGWDDDMKSRNDNDKHDSVQKWG